MVKVFYVWAHDDASGLFEQKLCESDAGRSTTLQLGWKFSKEISTHKNFISVMASIKIYSKRSPAFLNKAQRLNKAVSLA